MTANRNNVLRLVTPPSDTGVLLVQGLVELHKAVKGAGFYPDGHPYRTAPLQRAHDALARLAAKRDVVISLGRHGFIPAVDGGDGAPALQQLARECLARRIAGITLCQGLLLSDLEAFAELLSCDPHRSAPPGGIARQLEAAGVQTVRVEEKGTSSMWTRRTPPAAGSLPVDAPADSSDAAGSYTISEVLRLMAREEADARYQELGRLLVEKFPAEPGNLAVLPVLEELLRQHQDQGKSLPQREYALFTLERLAEVTADTLLESLEKRGCPEKDGILRVLAALGGKGAYRIIQRLCLAPGIFERRALATALVRIGPAACAPVIAMLKDERWYVVRNMVTILGELRCKEAVLPLKKPLYHEDQRVRKEAVRALMKIGGEASEAALISLLEDPDQVIARQAISACGLVKSAQAVTPLLALLERNDLFLKQLGVKKDVALALGRIGDRRATPSLLKLLQARGFLAWGRWLDLKVTVASALCVMGDEAALPALQRFSAGSGALAEACRDAVEAIESVGGGEE